ncbi:MAG: hypothetical protein Greene041614_1230 [Parcubacteria group bacterium Greene0416_14]|nr:MAG: hypothetical protein Greene041614_1230 [Parcubacteria group bacterium Greene0416_14]
MNWRKKIFVCTISLGCFLIVTGCRGMLPKNVEWAEKPGVQVPQVKRSQNYYPELDNCQRNILFAGKPSTTIMVVDGNDYSGKRDYYTGFFLSQAFAGFVMDPIKRTASNITMMDGTRMARDIVSWMRQNAVQGETPQPVWQAPPGVEFILIVEINGLDFSKGTVAEAEVFKAGAGLRTYGGLISLHARLVHRSGTVVAISNFQKDVPGITAYLKTSGVIEKMLVHARLEAGEHEAFQNALRALSHIAEYDIFAKFYGDRTCDKDAQGIFDGETLTEDIPPYKRHQHLAALAKIKKPEATQPVQTKTPQCPLGISDIVVEVIPYDGHNNDTFDPERNEKQRQAMQHIVTWWQKGCIVKSIEGVRCRGKKGVSSKVLKVCVARNRQNRELCLRVQQNQQNGYTKEAYQNHLQSKCQKKNSLRCMQHA